MKYSFILFILLIGLKTYSQTDSSKLKISVTLPAKDFNYFGFYMYEQNDLFGDLTDSIKVKYRSGQDNQDNNNISITATVGAWFNMDILLRNDANALKNNVFKRLDDALKLFTTHTYLIRRLTEADAIDQVTYQSMRQIGKDKHKRL